MRNYRDVGLSDTYLETRYGLSYCHTQHNSGCILKQNVSFLTMSWTLKSLWYLVKCFILCMCRELLNLWYFCSILNIIFISNPTDISHIIELAFTATTTASFMLSIGNFTSYFDKLQVTLISLQDGILTSEWHRNIVWGYIKIKHDTSSG